MVFKTRLKSRMLKASVLFSALLTLTGFAYWRIQERLPGFIVQDSFAFQMEEFVGNNSIEQQNSRFRLDGRPDSRIFEGMVKRNVSGKRELTNYRSTASSSLPSCKGNLVYMYNLPGKYNDKISLFCKRMHKFVPTCPDTHDFGLGVPALKPGVSGKIDLIPENCWHRTDQFNLEAIFHRRMMDYPCLTKDPEKASLFYVPYYAGLSICQTLYEPDYKARDELNSDLIVWLRKRRTWRRKRGKDHFIVLGRVVWDFLRTVVDPKWGNTFLRMSYMPNVTVLSIEGSSNPAHGTTFSVPYPTAFHPRSKSDLEKWQDSLRSAQRTMLVTFTGMFHGRGARLRKRLHSMCRKLRGECRMLKCLPSVRAANVTDLSSRTTRSAMDLPRGSSVTAFTRCNSPDHVVALYRSADFCLMPPGDTPTRKALFDCLLSGTIPVVFDAMTSHKQYVWFLPKDYKSYSVFVPEKYFWTKNDTGFVMSILRAIPRKRVAEMRENIINLLPSLIYNHPEWSAESPHRDAFDITMTNVLNRMAAKKLSS